MKKKPKVVKKYFYPKRKALLSLQFYRDKNNVLNFMYTVNEGDLCKNGFLGGIDWLIFGEKFALNNNMTRIEKVCFEQFCKEYIKVISKKFPEDRYAKTVCKNCFELS